jgi:hypothetical protein
MKGKTDRAKPQSRKGTQRKMALVFFAFLCGFAPLREILFL